MLASPSSPVQEELRMRASIVRLLAVLGSIASLAVLAGGVKAW